MIILGIDPALSNFGFGIIEKANQNIKSKHNSQESIQHPPSTANQTLQYITSGVIRTNNNQEITARLLIIFEGLKEIITKYQPNIMAFEQGFISSNAQTALKLGYARAITLLLSGIYNLPIFEYSPNTIKQTLTGVGHADKDQVKFMVIQSLKIDKQLSYDEADAVAAAICHYYIQRIDHKYRQ